MDRKSCADLYILPELFSPFSPLVLAQLPGTDDGGSPHLRLAQPPVPGGSFALPGVRAASQPASLAMLGLPGVGILPLPSALWDPCRWGRRFS